MSESGSGRTQVDFTLVDWLREIKLDWQLSSEKLAHLAHVSQPTLEKYLAMKPAELDLLPTIPNELEHAVALVSVYRRLQDKFSDTDEQLKWLFTAHSDFDQFKPVDVMAQNPENLKWVSYYLGSAL